MSDLKQQANIVKQNLYYHFADSCGNWMIPDDMKFLNEVLNDTMKLCKLANDVSDEPQTDTCNIPHVVWRSEQLKAFAEFLQTRQDFQKRSNKDLAIDYCDSL